MAQVTLKLENVSCSYTAKSGTKKPQTHRLTSEIKINPNMNILNIISVDEESATALGLLLSGLTSPESGTFNWSFDGKPSDNTLFPYIPSADFSFSFMTVQENIKFGVQNGRGTPEEITRVIQLTGLEGYDKHYPDSAPTGFALRIAIARALLGDPRVIILDNSLKSLKTAAKYDIMKLLRQITGSTKTVFILLSDSSVKIPQDGLQVYFLKQQERSVLLPFINKNTARFKGKRNEK